MNRSVITYSLALLGSLGVCGQDKPTKPEAATSSTAKPAAPPKAEATKPISALGWLVGGVWATDASQLGPGMVRIETRYQWADNHAFIRFNTHFVMKDGVFKNYDGNFFWNPADVTLAIWYMDARNNITQGPLKMDGDSFQTMFRGTNFENKPTDLRVSVLRQSADHYTWVLEEKAPDAWRQLAKLEYLRQPAE